MARRRKSVDATKKSKPLPTMDDEFNVPEAVQQAADSYKSASESKSRAVAKYKGAEESLKESMEENGVERVRVHLPSGDRWIVLDAKKVLKQEPVKKKEPAEASA